MSYLVLLSCIWQLPLNLILVLLSASILLCLIGASVFILSNGLGKKHILGLACFFLGLSTLYSVVTPPFQAPDEPTHFVAMLDTIGRKSESTAAKVWAQNGYFMEIKQYPDVTFKYLYEGHFIPQDLNYDDFFSPVDMKTRSPLTVWIWTALKPLLSTLSLQYCLLTIRLINGATVTVFYTVALAVVWLLRPKDSNENLKIHASVTGASVLLYIPTLPFFAMHVSNYPFLIAGGVLAGAIALMTLFWGRRPPCLGGLLGFAVFWLMFSGRGGVIFAFVVMLLVVIGTSLPRLKEVAPKTTIKATIFLSSQFWLFFSCGWLLSWLFCGRFDLMPLVLNLPNVLPGHMVQIFKNGWFLFFVPFLFFLLETAFHVRPVFRHGSSTVKVIAFLGFTLFSIGTLGPLFGSLHHLNNIEGVSKGLVSTYVKDVLLAFWGSQGLAIPDRFLVQYFWAGFGWLESMPRDIVIISLGMPVFVGNIFLWWHAFRSASWPLTSRLCVWLVACTAYLVALAIGAWNVPVNLHGRYLILLYLIFLPVGFSGFFSLLAQALSSLFKIIKKRRQMPILQFDETRAIPVLMMLFCLTIHCLSVKHILFRYFS